MYLKKIFVLGVLALLIISGCKSNNQVSQMEFNLNDGDVPGQYYSEVNMKIVPDYEKRLLSVDYNRAFPKRTAETLDEDVKVAGATMGGENFEKFLEITDFLSANEQVANLNEIKSVFSAAITDLNGEKKELRVNWDNEQQDYELLKSFYLNIADLLTESEQV